MGRDDERNQEFLQQAKANTNVLQKQIKELEALSSGPDFRQFWDYTKEVVQSFKDLKPLLTSDREAMWSEYDELCQTVKKEMAKQDELHKENASALKQEIENLRLNHLTPDSPSFAPLTGMPQYHAKEFWEHSKRISEMFKSMRLFKNDREQLWSEFQSLCEEVRIQQQDKKNESYKNREVISALIDEAYWEGTDPPNKETLDEAHAKQTENLQRIKENVLTREDRDALWEQWRRTNEKIHQGGQSLRESNFLHLKEDADSCNDTAHYEDPYEALEQIKKVQADMHGQYLDKDQREELYNILNMAWEKASSRIGEMKEEKRRKREEWQAKQEDFINRCERNIEKAEDVISNLELQIERLQNEEADARSDEYADTVRGWIEDKENKIAEIRQSIAEWEEKLYSARNNSR